MAINFNILWMAVKSCTTNLGWLKAYNEMQKPPFSTGDSAGFCKKPQLFQLPNISAKLLLQLSVVVLAWKPGLPQESHRKSMDWFSWENFMGKSSWRFWRISREILSIRNPIWVWYVFRGFKLNAKKYVYIYISPSQWFLCLIKIIEPAIPRLC